MHWADKIAEDLIGRHPERELFVCASGISPSGPVHVGNLRDIVTIWFVGKSLQERGKKVRLLHSWDDYDRFRKVPKGLPESYEEFIGKPLSYTPDPSGGYASYAARHEREFEESLEELGITLEFRYQTKIYESGAYRQGIIQAAKARKTIYDILANYRTQGGSDKERESYVPVTIYCEACRKDTTEILRTDASETRFSYYCSSCGHEGTVDLNHATNVKLPWKVDWAMRWRHEEVIFEPGGKDHATAGGSFEVSSEISKQVYHFQPPLFQPYEFIGLKGLTGKMSSSSGELLTPRDVLKIYQPEILLWVFARVPPARAFDLVVDDQIHRLYEEFDQTSLNGSKVPSDLRALELARIPGREIHPVSFRQLTSFSGIVQGNHQALELIFARIGTPCRQELFKERLEKAESWLECYAPDQRTVLLSRRNTDYFQALAPQEKDWVKELCSWLKVSHFGLEQATEKVYAIPKKPGMSEKELAQAQRRFFQIVYNLLFGRDKGPRLGTFLVAVPHEQYLELLNFTDAQNAELLKELTAKAHELESANLKLARLLEEQTALKEILTQINLLDIDELLKQLADRALRLLRVDHIQIRLLSKEGILLTAVLAGRGAERYRERLLEPGAGRSGWVMTHQKPLAIKDISQDTQFGPGHLMREMEVRGYLGLPMIFREQKSIGVLIATTLTEREFAPEEIAVGQELAAGAAVAIENATLYQETGRREEVQAVLKELSQDITSLDVSNLLRKLTSKVCEFFKADASDVRLLEGERWVIKASTGIDPAPYGRRPDAETPRGGYGSGWIGKNRKPLVIRDILSPEGVGAGETVKSLGFRGYLGVPLISRNQEVAGILRALSYKPREFTQQEVDLLQQLANGAAIALDNGRLLDEVRQKSRELEKVNRELLDAYQAKSDFLNTMAHELRTPLNVIIGNVQLLEDGFYGDLGEKAKGGLESIGRNANDLLNLINEILDLARLEAKRVPLHIEDVLVEELLGDPGSFFVPLVKEKGLSLKMELDGSVPRLRTDKDKIREVLQNLLANAIKYTDQGEVGLRVSSLSEGGSQRRRVSFCVWDTGIGITKKDLPSIFEPFFVVEGLDRKKYPGSGLGLSIARRLVELLEGEIRVESEFGKGSVFTVILPLVHSTSS